MRIVPETLLLDNICSRFYSRPRMVVKKASDLELVSDSNGLLSIIKVTNEQGSDYPFIDLSHWDFNSMDWYWFNSLGLMSKYSNGQIIDIYSAEPPEYVNGIKLFNPETGFVGYGKAYQYQPFQVLLNLDPFKDVTIYNNKDIISDFVKVNTIDNKEFRYGFDGYIYTNIDLSAINNESLEVRYFTLPEKISVTIEMDSNTLGENFLTPTVESYIVNLTGQDI